MATDTTSLSDLGLRASCQKASVQTNHAALAGVLQRQHFTKQRGLCHVDRQFQTAALRYLTPANASPPRIHRGEASASSGAPAMAARQRRRHASSGAPPSEVKGEFQNCVTDDDGRELETKSFCLLNFCAQHHIEFPALL